MKLLDYQSKHDAKGSPRRNLMPDSLAGQISLVLSFIVLIMLVVGRIDGAGLVILGACVALPISGVAVVCGIIGMIAAQRRRNSAIAGTCIAAISWLLFF
jgi:hypothetical protein